MNITKELSDYVRAALVSLLLLFIVVKIIFFNAGFLDSIKMSLAVYWMFILPGLAVSYFIPIESFFERIAASIAISAALVGVAAYYLGILGLGVAYTAYILPPAIVVAAIFISFSIKKFSGAGAKEKQKAENPDMKNDQTAGAKENQSV